MYELISIEAVQARIKELRKRRDKYLEGFSKNELSLASINNFQHVGTRLDELSRLIVFRSSEGTAK